jgi:4-hydroxy-2-oxoheptanedioate aldolase
LQLFCVTIQNQHHLSTPNIMDSTNYCLQALNKGDGRAYGAWQMLPGSNVSRALANQGFDWILVDCEHGNIDDAAMHEAVPTIAACGSSPIVRIPAAEGWMIKSESNDSLSLAEAP